MKCMKIGVNKKWSLKLVFLNEKKSEKNRCFSTLKINFESTILALFKDPELGLFTKYVQQFCWSVFNFGQKLN